MSRTKRIFLASLREPTAQARRSYALEACGDDRELRERVLALLAAHEASPPACLPEEGTGTTFDADRLLEELGAASPEAPPGAARGEAGEQRPDSSHPLHDLGCLHEFRGDYRAAVDAYRAAIEADPEHTPAYLGLGSCLAALDDFPGAVAAFAEAANQPGWEARGRGALAWTLADWPDARQRDPARAEELARRAIALSPEEPWLCHALGLACFRGGRFAEALAAFRDSDALGGDAYRGPWFVEAMVRWRLHDREGARRIYRKAVAWMDARPPEFRRPRYDRELDRLRAEAEAVLGIGKEHEDD